MTYRIECMPYNGFYVWLYNSAGKLIGGIPGHVLRIGTDGRWADPDTLAVLIDELKEMGLLPM